MTSLPFKTRTPRLPKRSEIDPALRRQLHGRANGRCESCDQPLGALWEAHHRKLRSRGGQDSICNLLALCAGNEGCHRKWHARVRVATEHGFIVSAYADPASVPVLLRMQRRVWLSVDGRYLEEAA
jgi:predicted restriction endonuclease